MQSQAKAKSLFLEYSFQTPFLIKNSITPWRFQFEWSCTLLFNLKYFYTILHTFMWFSYTLILSWTLSHDSKLSSNLHSSNGIKNSFKYFVGYSDNDIDRYVWSIHNWVAKCKNLKVIQQCPLRLTTNNC